MRRAPKAPIAAARLGRRSGFRHVFAVPEHRHHVAAIELHGDFHVRRETSFDDLPSRCARPDECRQIAVGSRGEHAFRRSRLRRLRPSKAMITAPAPSQSSREGRRLPSGHFSPQGMTVMRVPRRAAECATAVALRRQPAITRASGSASEIVAPFGEGSTRRSKGMSLSSVVERAASRARSNRDRGRASRVKAKRRARRGRLVRHTGSAHGANGRR